MMHSILNGLVARNLADVARAITFVESDLQSDQKVAKEILSFCRAQKARALRIGITGVPGAGKSTLIDALGMHLIEQGHKVAVLAIDPSSERSGGSILGDKTRMNRLSAQKNAFVRPSPSRGFLGGVAAKTQDAILVCEGAGFDIVIVETVGVGQSETQVAKMVDVVVVLTLTGAGDEIQGLKKGIFEAADVVVVNKSDSGNEMQAELVSKELQTSFHLSVFTEQPIVLTCSGRDGKNISELYQAIQQCAQQLTQETNSKTNKKDGQSRCCDISGDISGDISQGAFAVKRVNHLGIVPKDLSQAKHFFGSLLGLEDQGSETVQEQKVKVQFYAIDDTRVELLEATSPDSPVAKYLESKGGGIQHVAFEVNDLDACLVKLKSQSVKLIDETPRNGAHNTRIAFVHPHSTGGVLVELVEEKKLSFMSEIPYNSDI